MTSVGLAFGAWAMMRSSNAGQVLSDEAIFEPQVKESPSAITRRTPGRLRVSS